MTAAAAPRPEPAGFAFGRFVLCGRQRLLLAGGVPVELGSRAFEVLLALVEAAGDLVTKETILDRVWPDTAVEENNLQVQVSALRRALGPGCRDWIVTIPGRGYRFVAPVAALPSDQEARPAVAAPPEAALAAHHPERAEPPRLSVVVLPFANRGGDPAQDWFVDGITDSLTTDLARALPPGSTVTAHTNADAYKGHKADVRTIGREQGVRYVLEGSVLLRDDRVRVNAQLIAAETGAHVWADRFDKPRRHDDGDGGALHVQDEIVGRLSRSVGLHMVDAEARRAERAGQEHPGQAAQAPDYVLRAHAAANQPMMTRDRIETACALYESALELHPDDADALAGIACMRVYQVVNGYLNEAGQTVRDEAATREANLAEAEAKLARALAVAPGHLAALRARAVLLRARGAFGDAITAAEALLAHEPGEPPAYREIGLSLLYLGRTEDAVAWFRRAEALAAPDDPMRWTWLQGLGRALIQLGRDAEAVDALRLAVASNPAFAAAHAFLAAALALAGDGAAARAALAQFRRAEPATSVEVLARRSAVPFAATHLLYQARNERVLDGLRRAAAPRRHPG